MGIEPQRPLSEGHSFLGLAKERQGTSDRAHNVRVRGALLDNPIELGDRFRWLTDLGQ
jgi:hypothetical protein